MTAYVAFGVETGTLGEENLYSFTYKHFHFRQVSTKVSKPETAELRLL